MAKALESSNSRSISLRLRAVQTHRLYLDADELLALQLGERPIPHSNLRPTIHAGLDRIPVAKSLRQRTPLAAVLGHIEHRVAQQSLGGTHGKLLSFDEARDEFTRSYLSQILQITGGHVSQAARLTKRNCTDFYSCSGAIN